MSINQSLFQTIVLDICFCKNLIIILCERPLRHVYEWTHTTDAPSGPEGAEELRMIKPTNLPSNTTGGPYLKVQRSTVLLDGRLARFIKRVRKIAKSDY